MKLTRSLALVCVLLALSAVSSYGSEDYADAIHPVRRFVDSLNDDGHRLLEERSAVARDSARVLFDTALVMAQNSFGPVDLGVAKSLVGLATCDYWRMDSCQTEPLLKRAIDIYRTVLGENHETTAAILRMLGDHYGGRTKEYQKAEQTYLQAKKILEGLPESDIQNTTTRSLILNNLALVYMQTHRLEEAESLLLEAVTAWQATTGPNSFWMGLAYENVANVYIRQERFEEAEPYLLKALPLLEMTRGMEDAMVAECLALFGRMYRGLGKHEDAIEVGERELKIWETRDGPEARNVGYTLSGLAMSEKYLGNWDDMKTYNNRCLHILEDWWGSNSDYLPAKLIDNAKVYFMRGQTDSCLAAYSRAMAIRQERVDVLFRYTSESQKLAFMRDHPLIVESHLSFAQRDGSDKAVNGAFGALLHGKALVLDALAVEREIAYCVEDTSISRMVEQHTSVCSQIAGIWLDEDKNTPEGGLKDTLDILFSTKDRLEAELSALCADYRDELTRSDFTVSDISDAMPDGSTLLEYVSYTPFKFEPVPRDQNWGEPVYAAFVLTSTGDVSMINLGDLTLVDSLIVEYRELMNEAALKVYGGDESALVAKLSQVTTQLYDLIFASLEEFIDEGSDVYISPYGMLNLLPFDLLSTDDERYLVERYRISYLSSGRDLLKNRNRDLPVGNRALVIADPDYDGRPAEKTEQLFASAEGLAAATRGPSDRTDCLADLFRPLPATKREGEIVASLLQDRTDLDVVHHFGVSASEGAIKTAEASPRVLHLATHGYYCDKAAFSGRTTENPLLYSGLALAGANRFIADEVEDEGDMTALEDGIMTSLEASGLNLVGTDLVVLSACQSGVGSVLNGEGVYGLRRAFQLAGARTVVMSMFDIPDKATSMLMERFYSNWLSGSTKAAALREASLSMLRDRREAKGVAHPLFWGGFILVGDPD